MSLVAYAIYWTLQSQYLPQMTTFKLSFAFCVKIYFWLLWPVA